METEEDLCSAGAQASGSSRAVLTGQGDASLANGQQAMGPASEAQPTQQMKAAQKSVVVPKSPRLGKHRARTQQVQYTC